MYEQQIFGRRLPTLDEFIPAISKALDQQFGGRHVLVENKRIQYYHKDTRMKEALQKASWVLNPIGMQLLYENINLYELRLNNMKIGGNQIRETYQTASKVYTTDGKECTCSYFAQHMFCRHLVMYRVTNALPVFDKSAIHQSLLKKADQNADTSSPNNLDNLSPPSPGLEMVLQEERQRQRKKAPKQFFECIKELCCSS